MEAHLNFIDNFFLSMDSEHKIHKMVQHEVKMLRTERLKTCSNTSFKLFCRWGTKSLKEQCPFILIVIIKRERGTITWTQ